VNGRRGRRAVAGLALLAALAGCASPQTRVVLVGDSITVGKSSLPQGPGYGELLKDLLGPGYEVVNVACSGSSSLDWLPGTHPAQCAEAGAVVHMYEKRVRPALPADVVTILLGTNDLLGAFELAPVEPDDYRDALRTLVDALHADGAHEVVLMSPPFMYNAVGRLTGYRSRIQELCRERPFVRCGPDLAVILGGKDFELMDVHPNASGHAKIAAALADTLRGVAPSPPDAPKPAN
jgi:lysophospholipase L1-like esterase